MQSKAVGGIGLVLVVLSIIAFAAIFAFQEWVRQHANAEAAAWGAAIMGAAGCLLGWLSFKTGIGRAAAILGTLLVLGVVGLLLISWSPSQRERPHVRIIQPPAR